MTDGLLALPSHVRERLASALEAGVLTIGATATALQSVVGSAELAAQAAAAIAPLRDLGASAAVGAAWIRSLSKASEKTPSADLVWSGPEVPGLHARDTRRVFEELIGSAMRSLVVCTYAYFDGPKAFAYLAARMDAVPTLHVTLLLNLQRGRGDTTSSEQLVRRFADRFWGGDWPGTNRPNVFYDPRALEPPAPGGVLHAKAVVADDETVFVTSANLTESALDRNIELGLLVRDPALAASVSQHFRVLIDRHVLRPLPVD